MAFPPGGGIFSFRRTAVGREPLPVAMSGVRMGERVVQIDIDDPRIAAAIAGKSGISGEAAIVVADEDGAERARGAAAKGGVMLDVHVTPLDALPFADGAFDAAVIHNVGGRLAAIPDDQRTRRLREVHRILRVGGRVVVLDAGTPSGLTALLRRPSPADAQYESRGGSVGVLEVAGFRPVRLLADRDGYRFTEGLKAG